MLTLSLINLMFISIHFCLEDVKLHLFALNQFRLLDDRPNKGNEKPLIFDLNFFLSFLKLHGRHLFEHIRKRPGATISANCYFLVPWSDS